MIFMILDTLSTKIADSPPFKELCEAIDDGKKIHLDNIHGSFVDFAVK